MSKRKRDRINEREGVQWSWHGVAAEIIAEMCWRERSCVKAGGMLTGGAYHH